jgi:hypothetical protein
MRSRRLSDVVMFPLQIKTLMQQLTDTTENPYDGLEYATRVLQETLDVDLVT